jgi:hypothetical protein
MKITVLCDLTVFESGGNMSLKMSIPIKQIILKHVQEHVYLNTQYCENPNLTKKEIFGIYILPKEFW